MKKKRRLLAVFLAAVLLIGTGVNHNSLITVYAETSGLTESTVSDGNAVNPTDASEHSDAQKAFIDAVDALEKDTIISLVNAYKENPTEETEAAFYAEYDKVEGSDNSAYEMYQALSEDEKPGVEDSYNTLKDIMDSVGAILGTVSDNKVTTYDYSAETIATVGDKEYTKDQFKDAIIASTETNPVVIVKDFETDSYCWYYQGDSNVPSNGIHINLDGHTITYTGYDPFIYYDLNGSVNIYAGKITASNENTDILCCSGDIVLTKCKLNGNISMQQGTLVLDNTTITGGVSARAREMYNPITTTIKNDVLISNFSWLQNLTIEKNATLTVQNQLWVGTDRTGGSLTNNGTLEVSDSLVISGNSSSQLTNNGSIKVKSYGLHGCPEHCAFTNNGVFECSNEFYLFYGNNIVNASGATMKIDGNLRLYGDYNATNSFTNNGNLTVLGNIDNGSNATDSNSNNCTVANNGTMYRSSSYTDSGKEITGTGKMLTATESVSVTDLATTITAGTSFDKEVVVGDDSKYSATVKYFVGDTEDTNTNAGYNKTYTAKIIVTPVMTSETTGYAFTTKPTATLNGTSCSDSDVTLNSDGTVTISYTYPATAKAKILGIVTPDPITDVSNGTAKDAAALGLPTTVTIETEDADITTAGVTWDLDNLASGSYNPEVLEEQTFTVNGTVTLPSGVDQNSVSLTVQINVTVSNADTAANVTADVTPGEYSSNQSVTLSTTTSGADIYYTTDGTVPGRTNGTKYTGAISVTGTAGKDVTTTIKAVAVKNGMYSSEVQSFTYTIRLEGTKPYIEGDNGTAGWDAIEAKINNTEDGTSVIVNMNGTTTVPGNVFDSVKGRDINIVFEMENGITWTVNGNSVTKDNIGEIDFAVTTGTNTIPVDVVNTVTGEKYSIQISLAYDGEFGFTATLSINMDKKNAGYYANLYYYNKTTGKLEFMNAGKIDESGNVSLTFTHASDYTIVVSDKAMNETEDETPTTPTDTDSPKTGDESPIVLLWVLVMVSGFGLCGLAYTGKRRKKEMR